MSFNKKRYNYLTNYVELFKCHVQDHVYFLHFIIFSSPLFFSLNLSYIFCMHGETLQKGQSWPGRKICTFSIFVLCTALLILNPIIYYLNPSIKKDLLNVHFVCM